MSFKDNLPDEKTRGIIFSLGFVIAIGIYVVHVAGNFKKEPDRSVVFPGGEAKK